MFDAASWGPKIGEAWTYRDASYCDPGLGLIHMPRMHGSIFPGAVFSKGRYGLDIFPQSGFWSCRGSPANHKCYSRMQVEFVACKITWFAARVSRRSIRRTSVTSKPLNLLSKTRCTRSARSERVDSEETHYSNVLRTWEKFLL